MYSASPRSRRKGTAAGRTALQLSRDVAWWSCVFFLLGAPVLPAQRTIATLVTALIVSCTWPLSLPAWCAQISASTQRERLLEPQLESVTDLFTVVPPDHHREGGKRSAAELLTSSGTHLKGASSIVVESTFDCKAAIHAGKLAEVLKESSEASRCFILAAVLLCGSLFGQLDWQVPYQVWPYPSLVAYVVVRAVYALLDLKEKLYSVD
ncbi:hypothetical protein ABL78_5501 [Leptomonas seymouri]|uniref:Uncharacterized protein n=1 Tax=Leptomonas seymouri TaxID=5684 RepID=A0A0N0P508_LEPSE|nr:hypothetical protein ABL78_5501 [Leptomonas seymouri]|eukprot:KPI85447.1 hypothetical protein ABL78_5501 [Leptomonas seymouri]